MSFPSRCDSAPDGRHVLKPRFGGLRQVCIRCTYERTLNAGDLPPEQPPADGAGEDQAQPPGQGGDDRHQPQGNG